MSSRLIRTASILVALTLIACSGGGEGSSSSESVDFAQAASDLPVDQDIIYGKLPNGLRYAVRSNATPSKTATLLIRIDTGSLNETEETRGLAHFLEHMAFNGSENVPEGEMTKRLERFGLAFGADTNASTSFDETIYSLELPDVSEEMLNETLGIMRETAERLTLAPDAIDRERGVIQAERRARSNPGFRAFLDQLDFLAGHTILPDRLPIGTEETIDSVTPEQFRAFYSAWYRPENTFVTLVGDLETDYAIQKIEEFFGDWQSPEGIEAGKAIVIDSIGLTEPRSRVYTDPEIRTSVSINLVKPYEPEPDTVRTRREALIESLGNRMLNRRLGKLTRTEDAAFIGASAGRSNYFDIAEISSLSVSTETGNWEAGLAQAEQALRQALEYGFTQAELDEQLANIENSLKVSVQTSPTRRTPNLARLILNAFSREQVVTTPASTLERFLEHKPDIRLDVIETAFRESWDGLDRAPQLYLQTSEVIEEGEAKLEAAFAASRAVSVVPREDEVQQEFAYTDFGPAGEVVKRERLEDLDATLVTYDNNVRLNLKKTPYEDNVIRISARIGAGMLSAPTDEAPGFEIYTQNMLSLSGLGAHKVDDISTLTAGRSVGVRRGFTDRTMTLSGSTTPEDLELQLQLMTAYATDPGYRPEARAQYDKYIRSWYPTLDSTPGGVASRDIGRILRSGDPRWGVPAEADLLDVDMDLIRAWMDNNVLNGTIEITAVGDIEEQALIDAVSKTFGALPERPTEFFAPDPARIDISFPEGSRRPIVLSHAGDAETARLYIYWPAPDAADVVLARETQMLSNLFELRLTEVLREEEGATYSPGVSQSSSRLYPGFGYIGAQIEVSPDRIDLMAEKIREVAAEFQRGDIDEDVFDRAKKPVLEYLETSLENNSLWLGVLSEVQSNPEDIARFRTRDEVYQNMTLGDLKPVAEQVFDDSKSIEVQILPEE